MQQVYEASGILYSCFESNCNVGTRQHAIKCLWLIKTIIVMVYVTWCENERHGSVKR